MKVSGYWKHLKVLENMLWIYWKLLKVERQKKKKQQEKKQKIYIPKYEINYINTYFLSDTIEVKSSNQNL